MIKAPVYSMAGQLLEQIEVDESRFGGTIHRDVLRQSIIAYEANQRVGTAKTKTRAEVKYSGRKPWRQKHMGRARAGTRASPLWVGGGVTHGPVPRDHSQKLNKKMRRMALGSAILAKLQDGHGGVMHVSDNAMFTPPLLWEWIEGKLVVTKVAPAGAEIRRRTNITTAIEKILVAFMIRLLPK